MLKFNQLFYRDQWVEDYFITRDGAQLCAGCFVDLNQWRPRPVYRCTICGIYACEKCLPHDVFECATCTQTD